VRLEDERTLRVGVTDPVLAPLLRGETLHGRVGITLVGVCAKVVAIQGVFELELPTGLAHTKLGDARRRRRNVEETMGLITAVELEADDGRTGHVGRLVEKARNTPLDVNDGLRRKTRHRGRTNVVDAQGDCPEAPRKTATAWTACLNAMFLALSGDSDSGRAIIDEHLSGLDNEFVANVTTMLHARAIVQYGAAIWLRDIDGVREALAAAHRVRGRWIASARGEMEAALAALEGH
jgi:hypothetical protein